MTHTGMALFGAILFGLIGAIFGTFWMMTGVAFGIWAGIQAAEDEAKKQKSAGQDTPDRSESSTKNHQATRIFRCPHCTKKIRASLPLSGRIGKCAACNGRFSLRLDQEGGIITERLDSPRGRPGSNAQSTELDECFQILGVPISSAPNEVREAYRTRIRQYHPDRLSGMGEKLQAMAEEESKAINAAYAQLKAKGRAT